MSLPRDLSNAFQIIRLGSGRGGEKRERKRAVFIPSHPGNVLSTVTARLDDLAETIKVNSFSPFPRCVCSLEGIHPQQPTLPKRCWSLTSSGWRVCMNSPGFRLSTWIYSIIYCILAWIYIYLFCPVGSNQHDFILLLKYFPSLGIGSSFSWLCFR